MILHELALFAGAGGGILASRFLGWRTVCAVECEPYAASVLISRQNDGILQPFPVWDDVCTFDGRPWRGLVDVVSGGFPCQDISPAGKKYGIKGKRSGLWKEFVRVVREVRPEYVFVENSSALIVRGLDVVLGDLAGMGYDAEWCVLGANSVGAPQIRARVWIVASSGGNRLPGFYSPEGRETEAQREWMDITRVVGEIQQGKRDSIPQSWISRKNDGVAARVDRTKAIGNGQVPECAALAFQMMASRF